MLSNSFVIQIIILISVLLFLLLDFFGVKKKKIADCFGIGILGIGMIVFSSIEASDSFKVHEESVKNIVQNKKMEKIESKEIDKEKQSSINKEIEPSKQINNKVENINKVTEGLNNKEIENSTNNNKEEKLKEELKEKVKEKLEIEKEEKIENKVSKMNENKKKMSKELQALIMLEDNIKNKEKWKDKIINRISKLREISNKEKNIKYPLELTNEYNSYLQNIANVESTLNSLQTSIANEDIDMIKDSFEILKQLKDSM